MPHRRFVRFGNPAFFAVLVVAGVAMALLWKEQLRSPGIGQGADTTRAVPSQDAGRAIAPPAKTLAADAAPVGPPPTDEDRRRAARALVEGRLRHPGSAVFRNERVLQGGEIVCLDVNARDDAGGELGFSRAVVISRPGAEPVVWVDQGREVIAHTACEMA